jgi:hypothetical protein
MKRIVGGIATLVLLIGGRVQAQADPMFDVVWTGPGVSGSALLDATDIRGGRFLATSGAGTTTAAMPPFTHTGALTLIPNPNANGAPATSPGGFFSYDDVLYPDGTQVVDRSGLLFRFADNFEINIYNHGTPAVPVYVYAERLISPVPVTLTLTPVPEPGSLTLLGLAALGLGGYAWRRKALR